MNKKNLLALACILPLFIQAPVHSESQQPSGRNCRHIKSVLQLADDNNLDTEILIKLQEKYCSTNHSDKLFILPEQQTEKTCSEITTIGNFSYVSNDQQSRELSKQIVNRSKFICRFDDGNGSFDWGNGQTAKSIGGTWYYPNGQTAKSIGDTWYYPNGNRASSVSTSLLPWACEKVEQEICDRRLSLVSKLQQSNDSTNEDYREFYLNQSIIMLAWHAHLQ
ncbi:hypothetical protein [Acaryochloris marina]|uniref:C-type lectin domain-containing protein n=1 Tax=Acaryochloris marina (strain MBIC 11017) TaxID=329726 RepID=A8ZLQ0_ACAM1|nr:hypothetical protein [Acaryochloris marina]ABW32077.1 hypothetical protein AM1_B0359 [Acaryochloris marina MBIC11017]